MHLYRFTSLDTNKKRTSLSKWERGGKSTCAPTTHIVYQQAYKREAKKYGVDFLKKGKKLCGGAILAVAVYIIIKVKWVKQSKVAEEDNKYKKAPTLKMFTATKRVSFCATPWNHTHEIVQSEEEEKKLFEMYIQFDFLLLASVKIRSWAQQKWLNGWLTRLFKTFPFDG